MRAIGLFLAALSAAASLSISAAAEEIRATTTGVTATLAGEISVSELAASEANWEALQAQQNARPREQPVHRMPDGSLTSAPSQAVLDSLPWKVEPNADTVTASDAVPAFASIRGFAGINAANNSAANGYQLEPPDQGLAVNNNVAAEIVNNVVRFFNATTGAPLTEPIATSAFFFPNGSPPPGAHFSDTQAFFDPTSKRWFIDEMIYKFGSLEEIALAVSKTDKATGSYYIYYVSASSKDLAGCGGIDCLPDYPKAGYDKNIFIIDVDLFNVSSARQNFVAAAGYVLSKSQLVGGKSNVAAARILFGDDFVVQPSVPAPNEPFAAAANGTEYLMEARNILDGTSNIRVWAVSNTNNIVTNPSSLRASFVDIAGDPYGPTVPATQPNVVGPYCASHGFNSAPLLDGGYNSFGATIQKAGNRLYGALAFGSVDGNKLPRDAIAWFAVKPAVNRDGSAIATIVGQGQLIPGDGYSLLYPAFGLKKSGNGVMGFTETSTDGTVTGGYPSAAFIQFAATGFVGNIIVKSEGQTSDDGFSGCRPAVQSRVGRWGDYGAATVDAATLYLYTANEMIPVKTVAPGQAANWGTYIIQVH